MKKFELRYMGDPVLSIPGKHVESLDDIPSGLIDGMRRVLAQHRGYGIAAQQVGSTARVALCDFSGNERPSPRDLEVAINLTITDRSAETFVHTGEGCLSVQSQSGRYFRSSIRRHVWVRVAYRNENWELQERALDGLAAVVAQHEVDHLHGTCIVDSLSRQQRRMAERIVGRRP